MSEVSEKTLVEAIDETAMKLLKKIDSDDRLEGDGAMTIFMEKVKAFEAIAKWATQRTPLLPKTDAPKETRFAGLKRNFNAGGKAKRGARGAAAKAAGGADETAGASADPDDDPGSATDPES